MRRIIFLLLVVGLGGAGVWYGYLRSEPTVALVQFQTDQQAVDALKPEATQQEIWSAIAYFEGDITRTKAQSRLYSYYAAALSMKPLYQSSPLDKQASSAQASAVFTNVAETYPEQGLSVLFEAITLVRSPEFLQLDEKSHARLLSAWRIIRADADDGQILPINREALVIMIEFLPVFASTYAERERADLSIESVAAQASALMGEL